MGHSTGKDVIATKNGWIKCTDTCPERCVWYNWTDVDASNFYIKLIRQFSCEGNYKMLYNLPGIKVIK